MLQQGTIHTSDAKLLKPLLKSALPCESKLLDHSILRTKYALKPFLKHVM